MTLDQADEALEKGRVLGADGDWDAVAFGEMGIANTSSAAMLAHKITKVGLDVLTGRGTGLDDPGLSAKEEILTQAAARTGPLDAKTALLEYGGFEIAMMTGAMLGAADARRVILVDGFIATAAALVATRLNPGVRQSMVFAHKSQEQGHDRYAFRSRCRAAFGSGNCGLAKAPARFWRGRSFRPPRGC